MGVKAEKTVIGSKITTVFTTIATGAATSPPTGKGAVFTILEAADHHREVEVLNAHKACYAFAREFGFDSAGTAAIAMNLDSKVIRIVSIFTELVTGDVGIMFNGTIKTAGPRVELDSMFGNLSAYSREQKRLFV